MGKTTYDFCNKFDTNTFLMQHTQINWLMLHKLWQAIKIDQNAQATIQEQNGAAPKRGAGRTQFEVMQQAEQAFC
jgi:hypothetical protein